MARKPTKRTQTPRGSRPAKRSPAARSADESATTSTPSKDAASGPATPATDATAASRDQTAGTSAEKGSSASIDTVASKAGDQDVVSAPALPRSESAIAAPSTPAPSVKANAATPTGKNRAPAVATDTKADRSEPEKQAVRAEFPEVDTSTTARTTKPSAPAAAPAAKTVASPEQTSKRAVPQPEPASEPEPPLAVEPMLDLPSEAPIAPAMEPAPIVEPQAPMPAPEPPPPVYHREERPSLFVVHITPEMAPIAKVGGLADVVFGLTRELAIRGNHVEIILPKYDNLRYDHIFDMHPVYEDLWVPWYDGAIHCTVYFSFVHDRKCFFIEPHSNDNFFNRGALYGFKDDVMRFAFFSRAALEFLWKSGKHPDVIHCHDWQTALVPVFLYELYQPMGMHHPRVCLTIHNFKHQGVTGQEILRATGLHQPERFMHSERMGDNHHAGAVNLLKGGIVYSNFVTTVSPRYAFETKDQGQGFGLEPTLHTHHMKYGGVVNGVDYDVWNPEVDHHIPVRYGVNAIEGKYDNKRALRHRLMLADNEKPMVAFIGRLDPQKGLELVRHAIFYSLERGAQFVLLGSSPDQAINSDFWGLKHMLNDSPDCHLEIGFDEDLSHLIYAGSDIMIVPSQFEPCGLTQLVALRYGTIPVVRSVGGLADTVFDKDHSLRPLHERNGYSFDTYDIPGLESALGRAIACYFEYPEHFRDLIANAMRTDNSWNHPGQDYLNIYDLIRNR